MNKATFIIGAMIAIIFFGAVMVLWVDFSNTEKQIKGDIEEKGSIDLDDESGFLYYLDGYLVWDVNEKKMKIIQNYSVYDDLQIKEQYLNFPSYVRNCYHKAIANKTNLFTTNQEIQNICYGYTKCKTTKEGKICARIVPYEKYERSLKILRELYESGWIRPFNEEMFLLVYEKSNNKLEAFRFTTGREMIFEFIVIPSDGKVRKWEQEEEEKNKGRKQYNLCGDYNFNNIIYNKLSLKK